MLEDFRNVWEDNSAPSKARKSTSGGLAICLSACNDDQMAADTTVRQIPKLLLLVVLRITFIQ